MRACGGVSGFGSVEGWKFKGNAEFNKVNIDIIDYIMHTPGMKAFPI